MALASRLFHDDGTPGAAACHATQPASARQHPTHLRGRQTRVSRYRLPPVTQSHLRSLGGVVVPSAVALPVLQRVRGIAIELRHRVVLHVVHVAVPERTANFFGAVALPRRQAVRPLHVLAPSALERGLDAVPDVVEN